MRNRLLLVVLLLSCLVGRLQAADSLIISEFMADNVNTLADEDGDYSDWIEIHNPTTNVISAAGWYLTDSLANLTRWQFPATNIPPNGYLVVFASNKDRRVAGRPLHTNFRLDTGGEYLGLVQPDGVTVASAFSPKYPAQAPRVSYGVPVVQTVTSLISPGAAARALVPQNDALGRTWTQPGFDDASWLALTTGVGFETDNQGPFTAQTIADSVAEFTGQQGSNGWYYGFWDKKNDPNNAYSDFDMSFFPNLNEAYGSNNFWNGASWSWFNGNPPFTQITASGALGNANDGNPARADHWAIRRWISEVNGNVKITGTISHTSDWVYVTATGIQANSLFYLYLTGVGDGYIDDIKLVAGATPEVGPNLMPNGDFESPLSPPWTVSANMASSTIVTTEKHNGSSSLRLVATAAGTTQASSIWQDLGATLSAGATYTLSYWYKPGSNSAPLVLRTSGNWLNTAPVLCGDGVAARILVDGAEVYAQNVQGGSASYSITVPVSFGSRVDFALDPRADDLCDNSTFTAKVDTTDPANAIVADSVADWSTSGTQGEKGWFYGYYNRTADAGGIYSAADFTAFPRSNTPHGANNYWTGTMWDWFSGNPPWDEIGLTSCHPNGINNGAEHWVIRRWASEVSGRITVDWTVAKSNPNGAGVTGRIYHNGVLQDSVVIAGNNSVGVSRSVVITNVAVGDFIDMALDPTGVGGDTSDGSDGSTMTMVVRGAPSLTQNIASSLETAMKGVNSSVYLRIPFVITNAPLIQFLTLRMKYDDGFAAFLNGSLVTYRNAQLEPDELFWNSAATTSRLDSDANAAEDIDISGFAGLIQPGTNVLAIHGLNALVNDSDFLILPELRAIAVDTQPEPAYFGTPTPGAANGAGSTNLGPIIGTVSHTPNEPQDHEDILVTAEVYPSFNAISNVTLIYRVMFSNELSQQMFDDGLHGDGLAGDNVYGATIPATLSKPGEMVRYYVSATDTRTNRARLPTFTLPTVSPEYFGTVVFLEQTNNLPILHWFIANPTGANTAGGARGSISWKGQFRDNITVNLHGQSSSGFNTLKKSYNFDWDEGGKIEIFSSKTKVGHFNLLTTYADKSHMRNILNYDTYSDSGTPAHITLPVRVQQNGTFFAVYNLSEKGDSAYLERIGYDPNGALYKMYNVADNSTGVEKKTRLSENNSDLQALITGASTGDGTARRNYMFDNMDIPGAVNFLAVKAVTSDHDCCHKNYYFYRDTLGTKEWVPLAQDADLSFGRIWSSGPTYFDDVNYTNASWLAGGNNWVLNYIFTNVTTRQMFMRRVRSLSDKFLAPVGQTNSFYIPKIEFLKGQIGPDAALDFAKWTTWGVTMTATQNANQLITNYIPGRRAWLATAQPEIPVRQPSNAAISILAFEYNPTNANQAQEYICITNPNNYAVDISGWKIDGGVRFTFRGGTVLPALGSAYVTPSKTAFRARTFGPRGSQGLLVLGPYEGQLSAQGEQLTITDEAGRIVTTNGFAGTPSLAQQYLRVTEIMYHPPAVDIGSPYAQEEFEYLELKNVGPVPINLNGVHFTNGVDFVFSPANLTNLNAGQTVILARNPAAFALRNPSVTAPVFAYLGALENSGETIQIDDAVGEKILEFAYNNSWYPMTDGNGFSLVIVNENASWSTWGDQASWRASATNGGSPGNTDPAPVFAAPVLVNEVLANSDFPVLDAIEIYNPTANDVDIGDWWISDDFFTPQKYRIPAPRVIPAGGYAVFTEADFNVGLNAFSFGSTGDDAFIFSGNAAGLLTGYFDGQHFAPSDAGVSFGRYFNSQTNLHFVAQAATTLGAANSLPKVGPVIVSEILYNPPGSGTAESAADEFVELQNISTNAVNLYDTANPTNGWRLDDAVNFQFGATDTIPAGGFVIVVSFNPATNLAALASFRTKYGVPTNVAVLGPFSGRLDNAEDSVELRKPAPPATNGVPYILVERVRYSSVAPWDAGANGLGTSLQRRVLTAYGNDPTNWFAALPNAGRAGVAGAPPVILTQPANLVAVQGSTASLSVVMTGSGPYGYQWQRSGTNLFGQTNTTLVFTNIQNNANGTYAVVVFNETGVAISSPATVTVRPLPTITQQPASQNVLPGTNVNFSVTVNGTAPIQYQWRFNGEAIAGATNSTYSFTNAQLFGNAGLYSVLITDAVASIASSNATLSVLVRPAITNNPVPITVVQGGTAVFRVLAGPTHPQLPLSYRWLRSGILYASNLFPDLVITNCQSNGVFRVQVQNLAGSANSVPGTGVALTVLRDFDGDGVPDVWEASYGFNTNNAADGILDSDGDGMINRDEYYAGTNPNDATSVLKLNSGPSGPATLQFVAQTNLSYAVQWRTNLDTTSWVVLSNLVSSPSVRTVEVTVPLVVPDPQRYYRIVTPAP